MRKQKRQIEVRIYFTDVFSVSPQALEEYGALDISLLNDLPFFVDPFLLFNSEDEKYQTLHDQVIRYLHFLRQESQDKKLDDALIWEWFTFKEIRQTWLGFSRRGNRGRGLGWDFAKALHANLGTVFQSFGRDQITAGTHLEKLCLIRDGVGRDQISDFTTNLIKDYICQFTESFAKQHLAPSQLKKCAVSKAAFNYQTRSWITKHYRLPYVNGDYVLLTPKDLLAKDESWINRSELLNRFEDVVEAVPDQILRSKLNRYIAERLDEESSKSEREEIFSKAIEAYPEVLEYYIKGKEDSGNEANERSRERITEALKLFVTQIRKLAELLYADSDFYETRSDSLDAARKRANFMKKVIEDHDGYRLFYVNGAPIQREEDLQIIYRLTWYATIWDVNREPNNGRGPADYTISSGSVDKSVVEMKLASNRKIKQNLLNQVAIYETANNTDKSIKVIVYFSESEKVKLDGLLKELKLVDNKNVILIDARRDNKTSASNVR